MNTQGAPAALAQSLFSPSASALNPIAVQHNQNVLSSIATLSACCSGFVAGILGLTNLTGFALYLLTSLASGLLVGLLKCHGNVGKYVPAAHGEAGPQGAVHVKSWKGWWGLVGLGQENFLGFLLFWIGGYALIHVYD